MANGQEELETISAPTPEELKQEEEVLADLPADKVRASVIEKYGLTEDDSNKEFIDKLTADTIENRKALGKAIGQKRKYRDAAKPAKPAAPPTPPANTQQPADVSALVNEQLEQRDLESLDMPDEIKADIKKLSKSLGISVRKAAQDPYILHKLEEHKRTQKTEQAAITRTTGKGSEVHFDVNNLPQVDMSTAEGRRTWDDFKKFLATHQK